MLKAARHASASSASRCRASTFRRRSPAASPMCRTCASTAWCMRASCGRRATARRLPKLDTSAVEAMPGVVAVVRDGNFLAVVAERRIPGGQRRCARLAAAAEWEETRDAARPDRPLRGAAGAASARSASVAEDGSRRRRRRQIVRGDASRGPTRCTARSARPAPSRCMDGDALTVWSHTQGVYPDREAIAEMLAMPPEQGARHPHGRLGLLRP